MVSPDKLAAPREVPCSAACGRFPRGGYGPTQLCDVVSIQPRFAATQIRGNKMGHLAYRSARPQSQIVPALSRSRSPFCLSTLFRLAGYLKFRATGLQPLADTSGRCRGFPFEATLPDNSDAPRVCAKLFHDHNIARERSLEFVPPEFDVGRWRRRKPTPFMPVPEASMHKDHCAVSGKHKIRPARHGRYVRPVPEAKRMQQLSETHLRPRVPPSYPGHHSRSCLLVYNVCQALPFRHPFPFRDIPAAHACICTGHAGREACS